MATSSITKEFTVKDMKAYTSMLKEIDEKTDRVVKTKNNSSIERGSKLLRQFSFR